MDSFIHADLINPHGDFGRKEQIKWLKDQKLRLQKLLKSTTAKAGRKSLKEEIARLDRMIVIIAMEWVFNRLMATL